MKRVTLRKLLESIRLNGYEQYKGSLFSATYITFQEPVELKAACAYGQALLNLGVYSGPELVSEISEDENNLGGYYPPNAAFIDARIREITSRNDFRGMSLTQIADELETLWGENNWLDLEVKFPEHDWNIEFTNYAGVKL